MTQTLEQMLKAAKKAGFNESDVISRIQGSYIDHITHRQYDEFKKLRSDTGIEPSKDVERSVQKEYARIMAEYGKHHTSTRYDNEKLTELEQAAGIKPEDIIVQNAYVELVINGKIDEFDDLKRWTSIVPKLSEEVIQKGYVFLLNKRDVGNMNHFLSLTKIKPEISKNIVQEAYAEFAGKHLIETMINVFHLTGIKPELSEDIVQKMYEESSHDWFDCRYVKKFEEITRIKPSKEVELAVQNQYLKYVLNHKTGSLPYSNFGHLRIGTGIKPSKDVEHAVQSMYSKLLSDREFYQFIEWQKATGVKSELSEDIIQKAYVAYIITKDKFDDDLDGFDELQKAIGVKPKLPKDFIQKKYAEYVTNKGENDLKKFKILQKVTGIKPKLPKELSLSLILSGK